MKTVLPAKPEGAFWTDDQWKAIFAKDQDILVAAAAGSGKTAVLVERIIQQVLAEKAPLNIDEMLVVTFTNASAQEMRLRIGEALQKAIDGRPDSDHLRRQLVLLNSASISTLHSFCLEVIRKFYYMIDIDPGFRIGDETEIDLLRDEVLEDLFEEEYGKEENEAFYRLVDTFTNDRSDHGLHSLVLKLYDFARSHPEPEEWLGALPLLYDTAGAGKIDDLPIAGPLKQDVLLKLAGARDALEEALEIAKMPGGPAPRAADYEQDLAVAGRLLEAAAADWQTLYEEMNSWKFGRAKIVKGDEYLPELKDAADSLRKKAKGAIEKLAGDLFSREPESFLRDMQEMKPLLDELVRVVLRFSKRFEAAKGDRALVDFSDLEHLCLRILAGGEEEGSAYEGSEVAASYRAKFKEILVDEYQDVNMVQEAILRLVAKEGEHDGNLFMVGDVKQSIYRFRLAEPNLFLGKYRRFTSDGDSSGLRIDLSRNFRSRSQILDGTNFIFRRIMGIRVGEIEYNSDAELVKGSAYPEDERFAIELAVIDQADDGPENADGFDRTELEQSRLEARYMAEKIRSLVDARHPVYDVKTRQERPIQYRDIVVLLRSMPWAQDIIEEFKHAGIPVYANLSTGYFEATEVTLMLSLLKVIDNPDQDIPLAAVLRSPIVGLNEEELAYIRIEAKKESFYEAAKQFIRLPAEMGRTNAQRKTAAFFAMLDEWRGLARSGSLSGLIWQLYRDTGFYEFAGGLPGGKQRQANLRALYDRARQYEQTSFRGLFRFLRFIERMRERGNDLGVAHSLGEQEDVVRLMTIHSSKGLEFPVVFAAGLGRQFNIMDLNSSFLFDKDLGFGTKYINVDKRISYTSLPQLAMRRKKRLELLAEEMRVLYVAMTRAKEKLYLCGTVKDAEKEKRKWLAAAGGESGWLLRDSDRAAAMSYLDWIMPALASHRDAEEAFGPAAPASEEIREDRSSWKIGILPKSLFEEEQETDGEAAREDGWLAAVREGRPHEPGTEAKELIYGRLSWTYPHRQASSKMSKQSVSELKRMQEEQDEASGSLIRRKRIFDRPKFMQSKTLSPAERGTAMHTVMQHIPLDTPPSAVSVESLLDALVQKEILTSEQAEAVSSEQIAGFFQSGIGSQLLAAKKVWREVPFTMGIPAKEIYPDWDGLEENVLVQGIIDCVFEKENGYVLLDYKTDRIAGVFPGGFEQAKSSLLKRYEVQVSLYEKAIESIWKRPVLGSYLYFFDGGGLLKVGREE